jgi:hypothetical protein
MTGQTNRRGANSLLPLVFTALAVPLAYVLRFGHGFGFSDQDEFLPWLLARTEPALLAQDWFVSTQEAAFNVRSGFVTLLEIPARLFGIPAVVETTYVLVALALVVAVFELARSLGAGNLAASIGTLIAIAMTPRWTLGGNAAASTMLVPSMVAWAVCLWAVVLCLRKRYGVAGVLIGLAAWLQILVAAQVGAILLGALLMTGPGTRRELPRFVVPALTLSLPVVGLLIAAGTGMPADSFDVLARIRAPHHYLPSAFPASDYVQVALLSLTGVWVLHRTRLKRRAAATRFVGWVLGGVVAACLLGIAAWLLDWRFLLSLQPFKATVLSQILFTTSLALLLPDWRLPAWSWALGTVAVVAGWLAISSGVQLEGRPQIRAGEALVVADWLAANSPREAVISVPPSYSGMRYRAQRAIVVNFKAYPFTAEGTSEWFERLAAWAPGLWSASVELNAPSGATTTAAAASTLAQMDRGYESLTASRLATLSEAYQADWIVRKTRLLDADSLFSLVAEPASHFVYRRATR